MQNHVMAASSEYLAAGGTKNPLAVVLVVIIIVIGLVAVVTMRMRK